MDAGNGALSTAGRRAENRDSKRRSKAIPVSARHGRSRPVTVFMKEILILIIAALGYSQHAKPYCSQQPHSLPPDSLVLKAYPCDAGGAQRALYLLRNIVGVYHDMLRLGPSDRYASFQLVVVFIQLGARLALPARMHRRLATAFLSQLHRVFPLAYLLAVSYQGVPPSAVGQWYLTTQPALDFMANILFPVNPASECLYGTASMLLITAIWYRFAHLGLSTTTTTTRLALAGPAAALCDTSPADAAALSTSLAGAGTGTAAAICGISNVIADTAVAPPSGHGRSPYHLHTWLPFQLLMSAACTVATLLLERWRGSDTAFSLLSSEDDERPHTGRASSQEGLGGYSDATAAYTGDGNAASSATAASSAQGIAPAPPAEAGRGTACTFRRSGLVDGGGTDVGDTAVGQAVADAARTLPEQPHDHRQLTAAPGEVPAAPSNTVGGRLASVAAVVSTYGSSWACGIAGHVDESATSGGNRAEVDSTAVFPALNAEAAEDEAGTLGSAAVLRLSVSQPLQATPGSLSGFGPVWRDSELTEGSFMLGLLSSAEPVAYMEDEDASGGAGTGVIGLALHDGAGGSRSGGSSAADVVWQDQRQCAPPAPAGPAGASGGRAEVAGHMFVVSGSVLTARGNPVAAATDAAVVGAAEDNGDDGYLGRTHQRVYRLLRSLSSQASQPGLAQPHMQLPHPQVQNHPQSGTHQLASDQTVLAQPHLQRPSHPAQRLQQPVWPLSAPDGVTTTAVVSAAMQQARRPVYVPRVRIVTTHIKVQGVHPEQVQSGYTQRLEHVASAAGQQLIGAYVRAGCIELVLDSADWPEVKSSEGGETSSEAPLLQPSERDSGPLPAPLQPRPLAGPPYQSAPSTPSRLQQQQQGGLVAQHLLQPLQQQQHGMLPSAPQLSMQEQLQQQALAQGSAEHPQASWLQAAQGPAAASPISGASNGSARVDLSPTPGWAPRASTGTSTGGAGGGVSTGGGMWQSLQVAGASGAGGGSGGGNGGSNSTGADLDLGAVIRALRLHRAEGSAESTNDLASELDMDLEFGDRLEIVASGINSGGSGGDVSSKEAPIGSGGRRGVPTDAGLGGAMMNPVALGLTPIGGLSPNTSLLQNLQQHQLQQQLRQQYPLDGAVLSAPAPPPPPSVVSTAGSISRQALVLGGPRDPLAPGIVSLNPRVFFIASSAATATASEGAAPDLVLHPNQSTSQGQHGRAALAGRYGAGDPSGGGAPMRFSAVVRLVATTLMPSATATATMAAVAAPIMQATTAAVAPAPGADPEFTMRARGEYLPLRTARLSPASVAVAASVSMPRMVPFPDPQRGAAPGGGVVGIGHTGSELGGGGLPQSLVIGAGPGEGVEDTSSDIDTGRYGEGARAVAAWMWHQSYVLEVLEAPQSPGLLLVDMRGAGSGMSPPCAVPLVAMSNAAAAVELQSVVERWEGSPSELDDLLLDLGTWLHHTSQPTQAAPGVAVASPAPALGPSLDERLAALGRHLLSYAVVCGWEATAAALRIDLAKHGILPSAHDGSSGSSGAATCGGPAGSSPWIPMPPAAPTGVAQASLPAPEPLGAEMGTPTAPLPVQQQQQHPVAGAGDVGNGHRSLGLLQLGLRLRLARRGVGAHTAVAGPSKAAELPPEGEEREFRVFQQACMSSQIWVMTLLDCVCLAALIFRGRHEPLLAPSNVTTLIACCTGAVTAAARLVLPYQQWLHVAEVTKVPRHACYCLTKLLIGVAGLPAPPGISSYELGLPVFIFEAIIVPWSCLLSIPTAITISAIKMPVYMALWYTLTQEALKEAEAPNVNLTTAQMANLRAFLSPTRRLLRALAVASLFVFVTAACHAHIRLAYTRHNRRRAVVAVGPLHRRRCQWLHWL